MLQLSRAKPGNPASTTIYMKRSVDIPPTSHTLYESFSGDTTYLTYYYII